MTDPVRQPLPYPPQLPLPGGDTLLLRPLDLDRDIATLHAWFNHPHGRYWGLAGKSPEQVRAIQAETLSHPGHRILMCTLGSSSETVGLFEIYDPVHDEVGRLYRVQPGDRGIHLFVAPAAAQRPGFGYHMLRALCTCALHDPSARRVIGEPDVRNAKVFVRLRQVGFRLGPLIHMSYKTAQMVFLSREDHAGREGRPAPPKSDYPLRTRWVGVQLLRGRVRRKLASLLAS